MRAHAENEGLYTAASTAISTSLTGTAFCDTSKNAIIFPANGHEMIRISQDGFYVRGVKLEQDETEARKMFNALMDFLNGGRK